MKNYQYKDIGETFFNPELYDHTFIDDMVESGQWHLQTDVKNPRTDSNYFIWFIDENGDKKYIRFDFIRKKIFYVVEEVK